MDSVMVGIARRISDRGLIADINVVKDARASLVSCEDYRSFVMQSTADEEHVRNRLSLSVGAFSEVD